MKDLYLQVDFAKTVIGVHPVQDQGLPLSALAVDEWQAGDAEKRPSFDLDQVSLDQSQMNDRTQIPCRASLHRTACWFSRRNGG